MFHTSSYTLIKLAAVVWYTGIIVLVIKSGALLFEAFKNDAGCFLVFMAVLSGIGIGKLKSIYLFSKICIKNIDRINSLEHPRIWQFYRKRFFIFLSLMIILGKILSALAHGKNIMLIAVAVLELSIAFALFFSRHCFWMKQIKPSRRSHR